MINEHLEGAKISFMDRKESDLERKVWKLQQEIIYLDKRLENEKLILEGNFSSEESELLRNNTVSESDHLNIDFSKSSFSLRSVSDTPDPRHTMTVQVHRNENTSQIQPTIFFTWDCTPHDFHKNSAQRSIYTLLDHWQPKKDSITAEQFKKQLSVLLTANSATHSPQPEDYLKYHYRSDEKPDDNMGGDFHSLEKTLRDVESKSDEKFLNSITKKEDLNEIDKEEQLFEGDLTDLDGQEAIIHDDLIFDIFKEPDEEYCKKPMEILDIQKEVDTLQGYIKSFNLAEKLNFQN